MSASTAVGLVSNSLRNLLVGEMSLGLTVDVTVLAPDEGSSDRRVNLFLYRIEENPYLRNQDATVRSGTPDQLTPPPLSLSLYYLMTAYAPNDAETGNSTAQQLLGEAMRVFYDHGVVPASYLDAGLQDAREQLQIVSKSRCRSGCTRSASPGSSSQPAGRPCWISRRAASRPAVLSC
jgi:hypothetical protein